MHTVFIGDDNEIWLEALSEKIGSCPDFHIVAKAVNGKEAIQKIEEHRPDIVILDIVMPERDGIHVANHIRKAMEGYCPYIYILSGIGTNHIVQSLNALDIDFFSMKPVPVDIIIQNLNSVVGTKKQPVASSFKVPEAAVKKPEVPELVKDVVLKLGLLRHRVSTKCLIDALVYYIENLDNVQVLTKVLYPHIAQMHGIMTYSVEKNIRSCIALIQKDKTELFEEIFAYVQTNKRITNGEFLSVASEYILHQLEE